MLSLIVIVKKVFACKMDKIFISINGLLVISYTLENISTLANLVMTDST